MKTTTIFVVAVLLLAGCSPSSDTEQSTISTLVAATQTAAGGTEEDIAITQAPPQQPAPQLSATPASEVELGAVFIDPQLGYAFNYPSTWKIAYQETQSRGGYFQFVRADYQPDPAGGGLPAEEILLQVAVYLWDPRGDLDAYLDHRYLAWDASGIAVEELSRWTRPGGEPAVELLITGVEGDQALLILTLVGDQYLELSSSLEMDLLPAIGLTLRDAE